MNELTEYEKYFNQVLINFDGISLLFWLVPLPFILYYWNKLNRPLKLFGVYVFVLFFLHLAEQIHIWIVLKNDPYWELMKKLHIKDTNFLNITYRLACFSLVGTFYNTILPETIRQKITGIRFIFILCLLSVLIYIFIDGYSHFGTINSLMSRWFQIILSLLCIRKISKSGLNQTIWKNSFFLISLGILIPNVVSLFISFLGSGLQQSNFVLYVKVIIFRNIVGFFGDILTVFAFVNYQSVRYFEKKILPAG